MTKTELKRTVARARYQRRQAEIGMEAWKEEERAKKRAYRAGLTPEKRRASHRGKDHRSTIVRKANRRARDAGLEATLRKSDLAWPTHCPVLGIELDYWPRGTDSGRQPKANDPSLDRWDNSRGYTAENVFVVSLRANQIKGDATAMELRRVADYAEHGVW